MSDTLEFDGIKSVSIEKERLDLGTERVQITVERISGARIYITLRREHAPIILEVNT